MGKIITMGKWFQFQLQQGGSPSCQYNLVNAAVSHTTAKLPAGETKFGASLQKWAVLIK